VKYVIAATIALTWATTPALSETPQALLDQAMLLGPAQLGDVGGQLTIFGQAGDAAYSADLSGPDCSALGANCDQIRFTSIAPPADQTIVDAWIEAGHGGTLTLDQGWLQLTSDVAVANDAQAAFSGWNALLSLFAQTFDP
jgi:hypothetical protein